MKILFKGGQWTNAEDELLKTGVMKYGKNNWGRIASLVKRKTADQCKHRWNEWLNPAVNHGEWTNDEERKLLQLAETFPSLWRTIADQMPGRTAAMCLEHYEKLLDRSRADKAAAAAEEAGHTGHTRVRMEFTEQDRSWESKPARADATDMTENERDMIDEAVGRLANRKGQKQLNRERTKALKEAKARALLAKKREMREVGLAAEGSGVLDDDGGDEVANATADASEPFTYTTLASLQLDKSKAPRGAAGQPKKSGEAALPSTLRGAFEDEKKAAAAFSFAFDLGDTSAIAAAAVGGDAAAAAATGDADDTAVMPASMRRKIEAKQRRMLTAGAQGSRAQPGAAAAAVPEELASLPSLAGKATKKGQQQAGAGAESSTRGMSLLALVQGLPLEPRATSQLSPLLAAATGGAVDDDEEQRRLREADALVAAELERMLSSATTVPSDDDDGSSGLRKDVAGVLSSANQCPFTADDGRAAAHALIQAAAAEVEQATVDNCDTAVQQLLTRESEARIAPRDAAVGVDQLREMRRAFTAVDTRVKEHPAAACVAPPQPGEDDDDGAGLIQAAGEGRELTSSQRQVELPRALARAIVQSSRADAQQLTIERYVFDNVAMAESGLAVQRTERGSRRLAAVEEAERRLQLEYSALS